jgi:Ran GTPase-activating protein (RanGAP) involved in mRNA processing and transport
MIGNSIERASLKVREGGTDISLLNQRVGNVGMTSMAEALSGNCTVTWLDISGCDIGPQGIKALAPFLRESSVLQTLWLASNPLLGDQGCTELATGLRTNTVLVKLDLTSCSVGAPGCTSIVKALQANPSLRELRLALNAFGDEGATAVASSLKDMRNLQELDLSGSFVRQAGNAKLSQEFKFHMGLIGGNFWR